ncbi:unnamed protein product [Prorocentrum cordatum]|uniref:Uncharacterized protein n=1 Tax=Prorocentrum cordatum TaxID=2364126 RepID=A0ABN9XLU0_9DINO|nr:unnamed protein product [Polarella glacialis]
MAFMARALSLAGLLTTVGAQEKSDYKEVTPATAGTGYNQECKDLETVGEWQNVQSAAQCEKYATMVGGTFSDLQPGQAPFGCSVGDWETANEYYYVPDATPNRGPTSQEYHNVCISSSYTPPPPPPCQGMTCLDRFAHHCEESKADSGSNNNAVAPAKSPKDILVAECPDCDGVADTDICPTKLRLYDAAQEAKPTSTLDKTSVAVSVPLGLVSALVAMGALVRVSRSRASNQPVPVEDEQDLLRK